MAEVCTDGRFELIAEYKRRLIESTNIETSPEEMAVIDNILFRFWQMGWLRKEYDSVYYDEEEIHTNCTVQILRNSETGEVSVGWWENG